LTDTTAVVTARDHVRLGRAVTAVIDGERQAATLAPDVISAPVPKGVPGLSAAAPMHRDEVGVRAFAVGFPLISPRDGGPLQAELELTLDDRTVQLTEAARFCIARRRGMSFPAAG
jgi:hypothetical protein